MKVLGFALVVSQILRLVGSFSCSGPTYSTALQNCPELGRLQLTSGGTLPTVTTSQFMF